MGIDRNEKVQTICSSTHPFVSFVFPFKCIHICKLEKWNHCYVRSHDNARYRYIISFNYSKREHSPNVKFLYDVFPLINVFLIKKNLEDITMMKWRHHSVWRHIMLLRAYYSGLIQKGSPKDRCTWSTYLWRRSPTS